MLKVDWVGRAHALKPQVLNCVSGRFTPPGGTDRVRKSSPRDGSLLCEFGGGLDQEVEEAVTACRRAFEDGRWSGLPVERRKSVLYRFADLIERHHDELALLESLDVGKPIRDAFDFDVPAAAAKVRYAAEAIDKLSGKVYGVEPTGLAYELRGPVGVVAGIVGWNFPLLLAVNKIGPALAAGNSLVLKPSELTSLSAGQVAELALEAGLPEGVFNVIHGGPAVGAMLARHQDVDLLTFTGSSQTGRKLLVAAGESNMKRLILECGGKAPNIVFDDCPDLEGVSDAIVRRAFWNQGEVCSASSRLLIHERVKDELMRLVIRKSAALGVGDPLDPSTRFGAVVSREHRDKVLRYIECGEREGARTAYRSQAVAPLRDGFYVAPVIFDEVSPPHRIAQEEIFGPVLSVITFRDEEEAIRIANGTIYGLSAILWTRDVGRAHRVSRAIDAGWIVVNATACPAGGGEGALPIGGHRQSGIGAEGGLEGMEAYLSRSAVQVFV